MFDRRPDRAGRNERWVCLLQVRIYLIELPHLAIRPPTDIAVSRVAQIGIRDFLKPASCVVACSHFIGERLVVDEAACASRADSLIVEAHCVNVTAFDASNFGPDERLTITEIVGAIL